MEHQKPQQEWERHIENQDWETLGVAPEIINEQTKHICNYCRLEVSPDIGQKEIYCPHCEMITQAIRRDI